MIISDIAEYLTRFSIHKQKQIDDYIKTSSQTRIETVNIRGETYKKYVNEYWTSKQRQSASIHEISYRGCYKAQLPNFFIKLLTEPKDIVYDPFSGRGTTVIEAGLLNRRIISNDINPLSEILARPRLTIPSISNVLSRLKQIPIERDIKKELDLSMFYHATTEIEIYSLRQYLNKRRERNEEADIDRWIRMVATNRLTGHSKGFFSVYTLPPNQAVSPARQIKINIQRNQTPVYRDTKRIILEKTKSLIRTLSAQQRENLNESARSASFLNKDARDTKEIKENSVQLTITSPPFLAVVQYAKDNWLRCWFNDINAEEIGKKITMEKTIEGWSKVMADVFKELYRITKLNGWVAFEVGEVQKGEIKLEEYVIPLGLDVGFSCKGVVINEQEFTKTSNIWGIDNNARGTNSNRIVLFKKEK